MIRIWLILILSLVPFITKEEVLPVNKQYYKKVEYKVDFRTTLSYLLEHESYYANVKWDKGGETYAGITRRYNPYWYGWKYIDQYKQTHGSIPRYKRLPELDFWVLDFYLDIWVKEEFYKFENQQTVNYVFDLRINSNRGGIKLVCNVLNDFNYRYNRRTLSANMIDDINKVNQESFLNELKKVRINYYYRLVRNDPTQKKFIKHWIKRANYIEQV